jgi:hypothetical protein
MSFTTPPSGILSQPRAVRQESWHTLSIGRDLYRGGVAVASEFLQLVGLCETYSRAGTPGPALAIGLTNEGSHLIVGRRPLSQVPGTCRAPSARMPITVAAIDEDERSRADPAFDD